MLLIRSSPAVTILAPHPGGAPWLHRGDGTAESSHENGNRVGDQSPTHDSNKTRRSRREAASPREYKKRTKPVENSDLKNGLFAENSTKVVYKHLIRRRLDPARAIDDP
jgi:hypothetical protein